jgi:hypothetical protein
LIDRDLSPKGLLGRGERKSLQTDRVILVPGPENEIEVVRQIYGLFVGEGKTEREIARHSMGEASTLVVRIEICDLPRYF